PAVRSVDDVRGRACRRPAVFMPRPSGPHDIALCLPATHQPDPKELPVSTFPAAHTTPLLTPAGPGWDDARKAWNLAVDQQPAAIALPESAADVIAVVNCAADRGWRVAAQGTGHGAASLGPLDDTVLVNTSRMRQVSIDPVARTGRAEAGAVW